MALQTKIGEFTFDNCVMNASGILCSDVTSLEKLDCSSAGTFVTKTATIEYREGNVKPRYYKFNIGSINSFGLPNMSVNYYIDAMKHFNAKNPDKNYFLSVTEMGEDKIYEILKIVNEADFNGLVELNLSCPNVEGKPQVAYDFETTERILTEVFKWFKKPLGIKLPPFFDLSHFDQMAAILNQFPITYVNSINSIGNGLIVNGEAVAIKPKQGFGGLGGSLIKPTALANVHAWYQRLNPEIAIIGTGGISTGQDAFEHILCGASMVQIGTALGHEGPQLFERITQELETIMAQKGYSEIEQFRGKLQYL